MKYSDKVLDYFENPRNVGEIENASGIGDVGNPRCGDIVRFYIKVDSDGKIVDCKFKTTGCAAAIATSSMATELIKNKTVSEALKITNKDILDQLGGLPPIKIHCSVLAEKAIHEAIWDYSKKTGIVVEGLKKIGECCCFSR